ncbi:MAG: hypothetical protein Q9220_003219 [cf. Caloplaca sp. 1 TL-2023]
MANPELPTLSIKLTLSAETYSFSHSETPKLFLSVISNAERPFTIFTYGTILNPHTALHQRGFIITDLVDGLEIPVIQVFIQPQRKPFRRVRGCNDEKYFLTIFPGIPTTVRASFGPEDPRPKHAMNERRSTSPERGKTSPRRSTRVRGVDGLEAGHRYRLDVSEEGLQLGWWKWGTKDDILVDPDSPPNNRPLYSVEREYANLKVDAVDDIGFSVED